MNRLHVQAHRGASSEWMENTLPAFRRAFELGADSIELDVHLTGDGELVVFHDYALDPHACSLNGKPIQPTLIRNCELAFIQSLDCWYPARLKNPVKKAVSERRIPSLEEVFLLRGNASTIIDIEIKRDPRFPEWSKSPEELVEATLKIIQKYPLEKTVVRSFDFEVLQILRKKSALLTLAALTPPRIAEAPLLPFSFQIWAPQHSDVTFDNVSRAHQKGWRVIPYTANQPSDWERLSRCGVDGITTDDPAGLIAHLSSSSGL